MTMFAATIHTHHRHLLVLLSPKADTHFTVPRRVEGWVDIGTPVQCYAPASSTACSLQAPTRFGMPVAQRTTPFAARYDIGVLQRGTFKNLTLGMFINLECSTFRNLGSGHVRNLELGTTFGGHSDLGVQSGRKNQPTCFHMGLCSRLSWLYVCFTTTTILRSFVQDYLGEPVPEETLTHPPSWSSSNLYQLLPSTMIHSILLVKITCLAIFLHNLFPCLLWSTSWSGVLHLIFHTGTFLHPISVFFSQHMPIPSQPVLL